MATLSWRREQLPILIGYTFSVFYQANSSAVSTDDGYS